MDFRARVERLGVFGVSSVSLIVAEKVAKQKWLEEVRSNVLRRSFDAVFVALPARKRDGVEVNDHCRILRFYQ